MSWTWGKAPASSACSFSSTSPSPLLSQPLFAGTPPSKAPPDCTSTPHWFCQKHRVRGICYVPAESCVLDLLISFFECRLMTLDDSWHAEHSQSIFASIAMDGDHERRAWVLLFNHDWWADQVRHAAGSGRCHTQSWRRLWEDKVRSNTDMLLRLALLTYGKWII